jgi:hypothetical protein
VAIAAIIGLVVWVGFMMTKDQRAVGDLEQIVQNYSTFGDGSDFKESVVKTDSLVSPIVGTVTFLKPSEYGIRNCRATFTYQNGRWSLAESQFQNTTFLDWVDDSKSSEEWTTAINKFYR